MLGQALGPGVDTQGMGRKAMMRQLAEQQGVDVRGGMRTRNILDLINERLGQAPPAAMGPDVQGGNYTGGGGTPGQTGNTVQGGQAVAGGPAPGQVAGPPTAIAQKPAGGNMIPLPGGGMVQLPAAGQPVAGGPATGPAAGAPVGVVPQPAAGGPAPGVAVGAPKPLPHKMLGQNPVHISGAAGNRMRR